MSNDNQTSAPDEWIREPRNEADSQPPKWTLEEIHALAHSLDPDERLRLVARLWKSLPSHHRAALVTLQLEEVHGDRDHSPVHITDSPADPVWPKLKERLFDRSNTSGLYSAPRRFDLASIFVVTAAYSLLLGALSYAGAPPIVMVIIAGLTGVIAAAQALFAQVANPRGVSIATGAVAYTIFSWIIWLNVRQVFPNSFFFVTFINGIIGGGILGYLLGTLVGGVFLVADLVRGKFEGHRHDETAAVAMDNESNPAGDLT